MLQIYRDCRDLIINKYREAPKQRLAFVAAQQAAADSATRTDAQGLRRIYNFLDAWGLINYEAAEGPAHGLSSLPAAVASSGKPARSLLVPRQWQPHRQTGAGADTCVTSGSRKLLDWWMPTSASSMRPLVELFLSQCCDDCIGHSTHVPLSCHGACRGL